MIAVGETLTSIFPLCYHGLLSILVNDKTGKVASSVLVIRPCVIHSFIHSFLPEPVRHFCYRISVFFSFILLNTVSLMLKGILWFYFVVGGAGRPIPRE